MEFSDAASQERRGAVRPLHGPTADRWVGEVMGAKKPLRAPVAAGTDGPGGLARRHTGQTPTHEIVRVGGITLRRYAAMTRCRETGNGYPAGGLWAWAGQSPR
jgi:hypothetical protein